MESRTFISLQHLSQRLGLSATWLKAEAGGIPYLRAGRQMIFNPDPVEQAFFDRTEREIERVKND